MNNTSRKKLFEFIILAFVILSVFLGLRNMIRQWLTDQHQRDAGTVAKVYTEKIRGNLNQLNYASLLSVFIGDTNNDITGVFSDIGSKLLAQHEEIVYLAYFNGDSMAKILPAKYQDLEGKNLSEFPYSHTLAKVIKSEVIEGPETVDFCEKDVFFFINPIVNGNRFQGEIVAALEHNSVIEQLQLGLLESGMYDYELWRVDELGEKKMIIAVSDESVDFSEAVKLEFNLPANWNISIQPKDGWLSRTTETLISLGCIFGGLTVYLLICTIYILFRKEKRLKRAGYTYPDSGLLNLDGFCHYADQKRIKNKKYIRLLYIHLTNFHNLAEKLQSRQTDEYFDVIFQSINNSFQEDALTARLNEEVLLIGLFKETDQEIIEDFILQLILKKRIDGKKEFIIPRYIQVEFPDDGMTVSQLIDSAEKKYQSICVS